LNYWNRWGDLDEIELRFLDALAWHSDAISEHDPGARIIKFWTSIERTLRTSPGDVDTRAALLASGAPAEFADYSHRYEHAYRRRRNDVVHGNTNRVDESWYQEAVHVSEDARGKAALLPDFASGPLSLWNRHGLRAMFTPLLGDDVVLLEVIAWSPLF